MKAGEEHMCLLSKWMEKWTLDKAEHSGKDPSRTLTEQVRLVSFGRHEGASGEKEVVSCSYFSFPGDRMQASSFMEGSLIQEKQPIPSYD